MLDPWPNMSLFSVEKIGELLKCQNASMLIEQLNSDHLCISQWGLKALVLPELTLYICLCLLMDSCSSLQEVWKCMSGSALRMSSMHSKFKHSLLFFLVQSLQQWLLFKEFIRSLSIQITSLTEHFVSVVLNGSCIPFESYKC